MNCLRHVPVLMLLVLSFSAVPVASAQIDPYKFEVGVHFASMQQRTFSNNDIGLGCHFTFYPITRFGVEFETSFFPRNLGESVAFSSHRSEMFFGIKAGQRIGKLGFFGKARPGFIHFSEAPRAMVCILIYPPPLECSIASKGMTNFALDFGGIVETYPSRHLVIRADFGDTMIRFNGPALVDNEGLVGDFNKHNFQINAGVGLRF
jgi:hypothetical protein